MMLRPSRDDGDQIKSNVGLFARGGLVEAGMGEDLKY